MAAPTALTEANQQEMQKKLEQLASHHKKAKLQELFTRQDELRPVFGNDKESDSPRSENRSNEEIEAMKNQFNDLQKEQLKEQIEKQFMLRLDDGTVADDDDDEYEEEKEQKEKEKEKEDKIKHNLYGYGSDGSGDQKIDALDVEAMKAEFDKQQKKLLNTQIEKSFRLRTKNIEFGNDKHKDDDDDKDKEEADSKRIEHIKQDSEAMKHQFQEMNKMMVSYRSTKMLKTTIEPQIKPLHKQRFNALMKDIGIINECIMDKLWTNIENTVHQNDNVDIDDDEEDEEELDEIKEDDVLISKDDMITKLKKQNELFREKIKYLENQMSSLKVAGPNDMEQVMDHHQDDEESEDFVTEESDDAEDMTMVN